MPELKDFVKKLNLTGLLQQELLRELETRLKGIGIGLVRDQLAKILLKTIDTVVAAVVKVSPIPNANAVTAGNLVLKQTDAQIQQLLAALRLYIPMQAKVETQKKIHGSDSAEANAAREARKVGIEEVRSEVGDVFAALLGNHVED